MARVSLTYVCQSCGSTYAKWAGRCENCGEWNSIVAEEAAAETPMGAAAKASGSSKAIELVALDGEIVASERLATADAEFDRATGGGLVPGSAVLIGGDPGVGKSTLLLQAAARVASADKSVVYISGEEAVDQIRMRAARLGLEKAPVKLAAATALGDILATLKREKPDLAVIDSIQTLWTDRLPAAPGTVTQVRSCAQELVRLAKTTNTALILVGHVTKDGQIAGPRVVEHMVDAVLYFEAETGRDFRILRAVKNRFGPAQEIGVFEMGSDGLAPVANPSDLFLSDRGDVVSGSAVFAGVEGTRPVLCEFQALVTQSALSSPRRAVVGWDGARLSMLLAVLDARCGFDFARRDVFLSVAGGLRITEPAADLAAAAALVSSLSDQPLPADAVVFGEVGLSGAVRTAPRTDDRLAEARKLGFLKAYGPEGLEDRGMDATGFSNLGEFVARMAGEPG
ncbi:MAG: DNA repair protein RadA [Pseudomonadota bacterium]